MTASVSKPEIIGPAIHRLGGLTLYELHRDTGLPACFIEELLFNNLRPDTSWADELPKVQLAKQYLRVFQILPQDLPRHWQAKPSVCYHTTIKFLDRTELRKGNCVTLRNYELTPRTEPNISFVAHQGEFWEVTGGEVCWDDHIYRWIWLHHCYRNTERARHFRGVHDGQYGCVPCRQVDFIRTYAHGNYGECSVCKQALSLFPDQAKGPIMPQHHNAGKKCGGSEFWPERILEPSEAKTLLRGRA